MATPAREPLIAYLRVHAAMLRRRGDTAPAAVERLEEHAHAFDLLADLLRGIPEDDERLLVLNTLVVREGQFVPGPATRHALTQFAATSLEGVRRFFDQPGPHRAGRRSRPGAGPRTPA